jgi:hypothetical protein
MYNQLPWAGDDGQKHAYTEALKLAANGEEFSHLIALMNPDQAMRLRCFVVDLPESVRMKTIYGKAVSRGLQQSKRAKR